jgi:hypothetical protein
MTKETPSIIRAQENIYIHGYVILLDTDLDFALKDRAQINDQYNENVLQNDMPNVYPVDRLRGRDVIRYIRLEEDSLRLAEHDVITIKTPGSTIGNHPHEVTREYARLFTLDKPGFAELIKGLLRTIPREERQAQGTVGVNLFKTFSDVVSGPHQDGVQFVGIYIPDKNCNGAETTLVFKDNPDKVILRKILEPGELLIFRDKDFLHNVSPLESPKDGSPKYRNALILTVDYAGAYN